MYRKGESREGASARGRGVHGGGIPKGMLSEREAVWVRSSFSMCTVSPGVVVKGDDFGFPGRGCPLLKYKLIACSGQDVGFQHDVLGLKGNLSFPLAVIP